MNNLIQAETRFKAEDGWQSHKTFEDAQEDARKGVFRKYITTESRGGHYEPTIEKGWFGRAKVNKYGNHVSGHEPSAEDAIHDLRKFYPQIMAELKAIDEMSEPKAETKH